MWDNGYKIEEDVLDGSSASSYSLPRFDFSFLISIKHIDIETGLLIVKTVSKDFNIDTVTIKKAHNGGDLH